MFEDFGSFDQAFGQTPPDGGQTLPVKPLRRRKTLKEKIVFWFLNLITMPLVAAVCLAIAADGLRNLMGVFQTRLYALPIPAAGLLRKYDGFNKIDIAAMIALGLFISVTVLWFRAFKELLGFGNLAEKRSSNPVLFYLLASIAGVIVLGDSAIFYIGLESKAASSWSETPEYVPVLATTIYVAGLALIGAWHADYHCSGTV